MSVSTTSLQKHPGARGPAVPTASPRPASAVSPLTASSPASSGKKNILLLITDQQRALQWFPPNWEKENLHAMTFLKRFGLSFEEAVNNTCACTPSRTTIFTGTYPSRNDSNFTLTEFFQPPPSPPASPATPYNIPTENNPHNLGPGPYPLPLSASENQLDATLPNLATILADAGYETFYKGKYHLSKGVLGYDNNYYDADITRYGFQQWDPPDAGQDAQTVNYGGGNADNDGRFTSDAVAFLKDRVANPDKYSKPFCLILSLVNPHDVLGYPANWDGPRDNGGYDADDLKGDIEVPPTFNEDLRTNYKPTSQQNWLDLMTRQGSLSRKEQPRNYLNFYGTVMKLVDQQIGELLKVFHQPDGQSLWRNTMIVRTSDHGEMGLTHGGQRQKWFNVYEETIKIPFVWSNPELFPNPVQSDALVSLVDFLPTLASFCGIKDVSRYGMQGRDYSSLFADPNGAVQAYTYFMNTDVKAGQGIPEAALPPCNIAMVRDARFKYALYYGGAAGVDPASVAVQEEFYDLATDIDPATGESVEMENKSDWAKQQGAPWIVTPEQKNKQVELKALLAKAMADGVLAPQSRAIPPLAMRPRAKPVDNVWNVFSDGTAQVYQVIVYTQRTYSYTLQILANDIWADVANVTDQPPTTLAGNNGPMLFQPQPTLSSQPTYRVARTGPDGQVTYEDVVWEDYALA